MTTIELEHTDGRKVSLTVDHMPVERYERAFSAFERKPRDWFTLIELAFNQPQGWSRTLKPESFTLALETLQGTQQGFFGYAALNAAWDNAAKGVLGATT